MSKLHLKPSFTTQHAGSDGRIPVNRFEDIVEMYRTTLSESTIRKLLQYADKNKDGYITKEELVRLVGLVVILSNARLQLMCFETSG